MALVLNDVLLDIRSPLICEGGVRWVTHEHIYAAETDRRLGCSAPYAGSLRRGGPVPQRRVHLPQEAHVQEQCHERPLGGNPSCDR